MASRFPLAARLENEHAGSGRGAGISPKSRERQLGACIPGTEDGRGTKSNRLLGASRRPQIVPRDAVGDRSPAGLEAITRDARGSARDATQ